jgi:quercetin dioxygenase-like cupin family protein
MALEVRRIVTGHDRNGKAIVKTDEKIPGTQRRGAHITGVEVWSADGMPVDVSDAAEPAQRRGHVVRHNYVGSGQGNVIRVVSFAPGGPPFMHRTETLDYGILLSGECDLVLDSGEVAHMKQGDICVQRGTMHAWKATGSEPAVIAFVLIDAKPAGEGLNTHYPANPWAPLP